MAARVKLDRSAALIDENVVIVRALGAAQRCCTRQTAEHARRCEAQQAEIGQLRAQLIARDASIGHLREDLAALLAAGPGLKARVELDRENRRQARRIHDLEHDARQLQQQAERHRRRAEELALQLQKWQGQRNAQPSAAVAADAGVPKPQGRLAAQAVLCVGGRTAAVPLYRHIVERVGGRFLHHDGFEEHGSARLDATLAAADLVICQTGCISHGAFWRVRDHCQRTGKRCVFVETPSTAGLKRALAELEPVATPAAQG